MAAALGWLRAPEYRTEIQDILRPDGTLIDLADIWNSVPRRKDCVSRKSPSGKCSRPTCFGIGPI